MPPCCRCWPPLGVAARVRDIGQETIASTPEEYNAYILAEMKKWEPVVKATGAKLD